MEVYRKLGPGLLPGVVSPQQGPVPIAKEGKTDVINRVIIINSSHLRCFISRRSAMALQQAFVIAQLPTPSPQYAVGLVTDSVAYISTVYLRPWPGREGCLHCCRTSFPLIKIRPNFSPAATEPRLGLTPNQPLPFDPRIFWRAGGHLSRLDVTLNVQARHITPKLQGYWPC